MLLNIKINQNEQDLDTSITKQCCSTRQTNLASISKHKINKIRSNLLLFVDTELNIIKKKCLTKFNNKSQKEIEKEHNRSNNTVILKTETYSTHCLLHKIGNDLTIINSTNYKQKEEYLTKFSSECPMTKFKTHQGYKRIFQDDLDEEVINRKTLMRYKDSLFFKQKLRKDRKDNQKEKYEMLKKNTMNSEKTPSFNHRCYKANSVKFGSKSFKLKDMVNRNDEQNSFMFLRKLVVLIKNPLDTRNIKSNKIMLNKMKFLEFNKSNRIKTVQNPKDDIRTTSNRLNCSEATKLNMSLGQSQIMAKIKKHSVNFMIPPINKNCVEESKKYFFGADLK